MALETDGQIPSSPFPDTGINPAGKGALDVAATWLKRATAAVSTARDVLRAGFAKLPFDRLFTSVARRIFMANLVGLSFLIAGILYLSQHQDWLIDAKRESLRIQGEIIASAIAANAKIERSGEISLDANQLPMEGSLIPFRNDAFAALELSIKPEIVTPILRRLMRPTDTRARIYARDYTLIADSNELLTLSQMRQQIKDHGKAQISSSTPPSPGKPVPLTSFWTKLSAWFDPSSMSVYHEIKGERIGRYAEVRRAMKTGQTNHFAFLTQKGEYVVTLAAPIKRNNNVHGVLLLSTRPGEMDTILGDERRRLWLMSGVALLATLIASMLLTKTISKPMRELSRAAIHVRTNIKARAELPEFRGRTDEIGKLAVTFRDMTAALYRRIEASEKFAADVAHELKNPLTAAKGTAEMMAYVKTDEKRDELVARVCMELDRLSRLITDVASASRLDAELALQEVEPIDLRDLANDVRDVFNDILGATGNSVKLIVPDLPADARDLIVNGHEGRLGQVLTNVIDNALSFSPPKGIVTVKLRRQGSDIELRIEDEGAGIPADALEKIFTRFHSDRPATETKRGKNSGLGLSISREIIRAHEGRIWAENLGTPLKSRSRDAALGTDNPAGDGAVFIIRLPAAYPNLFSSKRRTARWN